MKIKEGFVLTDVGDSKIAVAVGETAKEFKGIVRLNETGAFIWNCISEGLNKEEVAEKLVNEYEGVDFTTALESVEEMIEKLKKDKIIEE